MQITPICCCPWVLLVLLNFTTFFVAPFSREGTLIEKRPGYDADNTHAFVIKSTTKNLYLVADTKVECDMWVRGLRYMLLS